MAESPPGLPHGLQLCLQRLRPPVRHRARPHGLPGVFSGAGAGPAAPRCPRGGAYRYGADGLDDRLALTRGAALLPSDSRGKYAALGAGAAPAGIGLPWAIRQGRRAESNVFTEGPSVVLGIGIR